MVDTLINRTLKCVQRLPDSIRAHVVRAAPWLSLLRSDLVEARLAGKNCRKRLAYRRNESTGPAPIRSGSHSIFPIPNINKYAREQ